MDTSEHLGKKPSIQIEDFQGILSEIDIGLAKFDDHNQTDPPLSTMNGLAPPSNDSNSPEVLHSSVTEGNTLLGGQIRHRKRLV